MPELTIEEMESEVVRMAAEKGDTGVLACIRMYHEIEAAAMRGALDHWSGLMERVGSGS
jgi:hypothetical protein